jgi:tRNA dimethylallyltransferase
MHARLASLDPAAAASLRPRDRQRILRALEIVRVGGQPLASWRAAPRVPPLVATWRTFELVCSPEVLAARITARTRTMWRDGLLEETRALLAAGHREALVALAAIGYDEAMARLTGAINEAQAEARMNERTRQMAKRQRTWFRHQIAAESLGAEDPTTFDSLAARIAGA